MQTLAVSSDSRQQNLESLIQLFQTADKENDATLLILQMIFMDYGLEIMNGMEKIEIISIKACLFKNSKCFFYTWRRWVLASFSEGLLWSRT